MSYTETFNRYRPLTRDEIANIASLHATTPAERVSAKYQFVSTLDVLNRLEALGWRPWSIKVTGGRTVAFEHRKHMIRLRNDATPSNSFDSVPEIVLVNGHAAQTSVQLFAGIFRLICSNGLIIAQDEYETLRVRHLGNVNALLDATLTRAIGEAGKAIERIAALQEVALSVASQRAFAAFALMARKGFTPSGENPSLETANAAETMGITKPGVVDTMLSARREADRGVDAWRVLNRVQERIITGNVPIYNWRRVNSVNTNLNINKRLWAAMEYTARKAKDGTNVTVSELLLAA